MQLDLKKCPRKNVASVIIYELTGMKVEIYFSEYTRNYSMYALTQSDILI